MSIWPLLFGLLPVYKLFIAQSCSFSINNLPLNKNVLVILISDVGDIHTSNWDLNLTICI